jgi:UDP-N-acetyl-D-glucosamine dehydrogenase
MKKVSVLGLGYVGLPLALLAAEKSYDVVGIDLDKNRIAAINAKKDPIQDEYIAERIASTAMVATTQPDSISSSDIVIICVPTPVKHDYEPDLGPVRSAVTAAAKQLSKGTLVIVESTINPGVCDEVVIPLLEEVSGLKINKDFRVAHCPERINPGDPKWNVTNIARVVGASDKTGLKQAVDFYESIIDAPIKPMGSLKEAEAVKVVENSFRDVNIAFVNELAKSFTKLGINVKNVIDGAATKPFSFIPHYPSVGVGGHCIPVDPYYLIEYARGYGFEHEFLSLARTINNSMPAFTVGQLIDGLNEVGMSLKGTKVTVLGLSYKANVADDRESPSYKVIEILKKKGALVTTHDPYFPDKSDVKSIDEALKGQDAAIIATNHTEFVEFDYAKSNLKVLVDGKNCISQKTIATSNLVFRGIGV